ncbi:MAG: sulfatase-like hydrolase/transferase [Opitutales bacterium]
MKKVLTVLTIFLSVVVVQNITASDKQSKNVLLVLVDDLRPEINSWGNRHFKTPNMDRLAEKGTSFTRAYCQYANCSP